MTFSCFKSLIAFAFSFILCRGRGWGIILRVVAFAYPYSLFPNPPPPPPKKKKFRHQTLIIGLKWCTGEPKSFWMLQNPEIMSVLLLQITHFPGIGCSKAKWRYMLDKSLSKIQHNWFCTYVFLLDGDLFVG